MKIAICDDEKSWIDNILNHLKEYKRRRNIEIYTDYFLDGASLLKRRREFDVVFLDYQMDKLNGMETAQRLRDANCDCFIIFVSAYPGVALDAYEVNAFRFLVKPINRTKLFKALDDFRKLSERDDFFVVRSHEDGTIKIKLSEIISCEAVDKGTLIHTVNGDIKTMKYIKEVGQMLPSDKFLRTHKGYIVSFFHIKTYNNNEIVFNDGSTAYISRANMAPFRAAFREYVLRYNMEIF